MKPFFRIDKALFVSGLLGEALAGQNNAIQISTMTMR